MRPAIYLSAFGWITQDPAGHRLRWRYPADVHTDGAYLGFPQTVVVERAPVNADFVFQVERLDPPPAWSITPVGWWESLGDMRIAPAGERISLNLVQTVRFIYHGTSARIIAIDVDATVPPFDRVVHDGEPVVITGASLTGLNVLALGDVNFLEDVRVLDLFADRGLNWEPVVKIGVAATVDAPWADVEARHSSPRMTPDRWDELRSLAQAALESSPEAPRPDGLSAWEAFHLVLGMRWEHAVLFASGWYDDDAGGTRPQSPLDELISPLSGLPTTDPVEAYRIVDTSGRVDASNIATALNRVAPDLQPPAPPSYEEPAVMVWPPQDPGGEAVEQRYVATYGVRWSSGDPSAIGVQLTEEVSGSSSAGGAPQSFVYETRSPDRAGAVSGRVDRRIDVPFVDVTLIASARCMDAWDRMSSPSPTGPPSGLVLGHEPVPPPLAFASRDGDRVTLHQLIAGVDERGQSEPGPQHAWVPDRLVREASGRVVVLRQEGRLVEPATMDVTVQHPLAVGTDGEHTVRMTDPPGLDATSFVGGWLAAGGVRVRIDWASQPGPGGTELRYRAPLDAWRSPVTFGPGPGVLFQDPGASSLWQEVAGASFPAEGLPDSLEFTDPVDATLDEVVTFSYTTRVRSLGRMGPMGNIVTVTWLPPVPLVPPPFEVTPLGRDFYDRTLVKVVLITPLPGRFTLWWAEGSLDDVAFRARATPGQLGYQEAPGGVLYDVLGLPLPGQSEREVTFGLQQVNGAGGQSGFRLLTVTLPPATS
jgi:hypothetical protein